MRTSLIIPQDPVYPASMDWTFLRREGIRQIEKLGSDIWTDYNLHDPGITIMEILCYAITDLGYRCNMPPEDLFAAKEGTAFYTPARALTCGPVTALDFRKILIDIPGVKNAWVEQMEDGEVAFSIGNFNNDRLAKEVKKYLDLLQLVPNNLDFGTPDPDITKLLDVLKCQSDKSKEQKRKIFRDDLILKMTPLVTLDNLKKVLTLYMADRFLPECQYYLLEEMGQKRGLSPLEMTDFTLIAKELKLLHAAMASTPFDYNWDRVLGPLSTGHTLLQLIDQYPMIKEFMWIEPLLNLLLAGSLQSAAMPGDNPPANWYNLFTPQGVYTVSLMLEEEADEDEVVAEARMLLNKARNLDEDYDKNIRIIEHVDMGIDLYLQIDPAQDALEVLCKVYQAIENYLHPPVVFYSLEDMLNRYGEFLIDAEVIQLLRDARIPEEVVVVVELLTDKPFIGHKTFQNALSDLLPAKIMEDYYDDIFIYTKKTYDADQVYKGPLLRHGFILEDDLISSQPRQTVFRSDLYQAIMAVEGVWEIERLEIFMCEDGSQRSGNWCLQFDCRCLPRLSWSCSYFSIDSNGIEVDVNKPKIIEYIEEHPAPITKLNREGLNDLPIPTGKSIDGLARFTSVQMDFPRTYKIGTTGISRKEATLRQAQVKQLQGYLLFYDQVFSDYLAHLSSVREILSVTPAAVKIFQPLYDVPGIRDLLVDYDPATSWTDFVNDEKNPYVKTLEKLSGGNETRSKLYREKVLDHLLARFGEQFTDFVLQLYKIEKPIGSGSAWDADEKLDDVIADKERFLKYVTELSYYRATGFNYYSTIDNQAESWMTENVEGIKKRVCAILGMKDFTRHTITCPPLFKLGVGPVRNTGGAANDKYEFYIRSEDKKTRMLVSKARFSTQEGAMAASQDFLNMSVDKSSYGIVNGQTIGFWANVDPVNRTEDNALMLEPNPGPDQVEARLKHLQDLAAGNCEDDGFHIIENILLRPRNDSFAAILEPVLSCLSEPELLDPYSFWMTIVVPGWTGRFSDPKRLEVFMQTVRREMPAHLATKFYVLPREPMFRFEKTYHEWIGHLCSVSQSEFAESTDELVNMINGWDESFLHYF